jgi:hypothetical protein
MIFPCVHVSLQFILPSIILLLYSGLYFEMSDVYLYRFWQHSSMRKKYMTMWNAEVNYKLKLIPIMEDLFNIGKSCLSVTSFAQNAEYVGSIC